MLRIIDFLSAFLGLILLSPLFLILYVLGLFDTGEPFFFQERVGKNKKPFTLVKFRTMSLNTESVATHMVSFNSVTRLGRFLRKSKLDELPQLINVIKGDMSLVGPRPCLFNQKDVIDERDNHGVFHVRPGITGLAQISAIDMSNPKKLAELDSYMIRNMNFKMYVSYIFKTLSGNGLGDRVK